MDIGLGGIGPKIKVLQNTRLICLFYLKFNGDYEFEKLAFLSNLTLGIEKKGQKNDLFIKIEI